MRCSLFGFGLLLGLTLPAIGAAQSACSAAALPQAARKAADLRHQLHAVAVRENDPAVPALASNHLIAFKAALAEAANAVFACASPDATPEELQAKLADALHANLSQASETVLVTRNKKDLGAYGSDLAVQVFPLYSSPKYYEVDFRYGVECGDDNLLIVFQAGGAGGAGWHEVLRWGASAYKTVSDAYGDFVLLTPLSGFPGARNWRFVVAHGEPACTAADARSQFDLDLLEPTDDPAQPTVVWHLQHPYRRDQMPRLSTTEDTLTFELNAPPAKGKGQNGTAGQPEIYRFHVGKNNQVEPVTAAEQDTAAPQPAPASTNSPQ